MLQRQLGKWSSLYPNYRIFKLLASLLPLVSNVVMSMRSSLLKQAYVASVFVLEVSILFF